MNRAKIRSKYRKLSLILIGLILTNAASYSQNRKEVNLTSLLEAVSQISKTKITYSPTITNEVFPQNNVISTDVEIALNELLKDTGLRFRKIKDYYVVYGTPIKRIEKKISPQIVKAEETVVVKEDSSRQVFIPSQIMPKTLPMVATKPLSFANIYSFEPIEISPELQRIAMGRGIFFALKTNLLYDVVSAINIGAEISVGPRLSINAECLFPWWTQDNGRIDSKRNRFQLFCATIEGRYWFGNRQRRPRLTGWFAGLYTGGGYFDLERNGNGIQGDQLFLGGASFGYIQRLNRRGNFRIEYSLGIGYIETDYQKYKSVYRENHQCEIKSNHNWHPEKKEGGRYKWIGPTKVGISLVWSLNVKKNN